MAVLAKILKILPPFDLIESLFQENALELLITKQFYETVDQFLSKDKIVDEQTLNDTYTMVSAIKDHLWEVVNTGHFSKVNKVHRELLTLTSLEKAILLLITSHLKLNGSDDACEKSMWELDNGLLLGCPLPHADYSNTLSDCLTIFQNEKSSEFKNTSALSTFNTKDDSRKANEHCDLEILERPSIQHFKENYFTKSQPVILKNCMSQWPAMVKWNQVNYLLSVCQNRVVPIEIGKNYTNDEWSQDLVKFEDFFRRQFLDDDSGPQSKRIEYLAQHNLFDQIPALRNDIMTPEYCCMTNRHGDGDGDIDVDIKAWLGPEGTISPMHIDEKQNLLCQVFGSKSIILAAPKDSPNLYPFDGDMLKNTSQIDAECLDFERFPLLQNVKFYEFTLHRGEMLYIPSKWWHFVRSLSKSFSVSFWWE